MKKSITAVYEITLLCQVVNVITVQAENTDLITLLSWEQCIMTRCLPSVHENTFLPVYERDFRVT